MDIQLPAAAAVVFEVRYVLHRLDGLVVVVVVVVVVEVVEVAAAGLVELDRDVIVIAIVLDINNKKIHLWFKTLFKLTLKHRPSTKMCEKVRLTPVSSKSVGCTTHN
jgi:hypothetical protein